MHLSGTNAKTVITKGGIGILLAALVSVPTLRASAATNADCLACHGDRSLTMTKAGRSVSLFVDEHAFRGSAHADLECVACHEGFNPSDLPHARHIAPVHCLGCHADPQFANYSTSIHAVRQKGGGAAARCVDCHTTHGIRKLSDLTPAERKQFALETCARCHADVDTQYMMSDHGRALAAGVQGAPSCIDCHDEHEVLSPSNADAQTSRTKEAEMCLRCHRDNPEVRAKVGPSAKFISSYENSVHARAVRSGNDSAATCTDCHGGHDLRKGSEPGSKVARVNIATTCGRCHADILEQYRGSIHGQALQRGITASATCTDCHGEHNILSPRDANSPVAARNISSEVCSPCHASVKLEQKFDLASDRLQSFADSYHGLAGKAGSVEVANCASCHGVHDIKPSSDPSSRINKANLAKTCGTCHPGANANFAKGAVHVVAASGSGEVIYLISTTYVVLIVVVVGGMAAHNLLDFLRKSRRILMVRRGIVKRRHPGHRLYLRMTLGERIQHGTLVVSFATLVFTGFALKFPDAWWVAPLRSISPVMFELRGLLHRIAGVALVLAGLYHCYYVLAVPRGKKLLHDLLPVPGDLRDALQVMRFNLGLSDTRPLLGRFSYIEKSEYWALVWGTIVMGATGAILWFDNTFLGLLTKMWWDAASTVHYYEAWLATLAIVVWHFYFVIFNPDVYPLNLAFWKGTLTEEEMEDEHPLELERMKKLRAAEEEAGNGSRVDGDHKRQGVPS